MKRFTHITMSLVCAAVLMAATPIFAQRISDDQRYRFDIAIDEETGDTIQTYYYPNGAKRSEGPLSREMRNGLWTVWYENGGIWLIGSYYNNQMDGLWTSWDDGVNLDRYYIEGQLKDGKFDGPFRYYYETGNVQREAQWADDKREGVWTFWYPGGQKLRQESWKNDRRSGQWVYWHVNGQKERLEEFQNGMLNGKWTVWYPNAAVDVEGVWNNGKKHGKWTFYYSNGQKHMEGMFENDEPIGTWAAWYNTGKVKAEGDMEAGMQHGKWTYWYEGGEKKATVDYSYGEIVKAHPRLANWDKPKGSRRPVKLNRFLNPYDNVPISSKSLRQAMPSMEPPDAQSMVEEATPSVPPTETGLNSGAREVRPTSLSQKAPSPSQGTPASNGRPVSQSWKGIQE